MPGPHPAPDCLILGGDTYHSTCVASKFIPRLVCPRRRDICSQQTVFIRLLTPPLTRLVREAACSQHSFPGLQPACAAAGLTIRYLCKGPQFNAKALEGIKVVIIFADG